MANPKTPAQVNPPDPEDQFRLRSLEQILSLFDGGDFLAKVMAGHRDLQQELLDHQEEFGSKTAKGTMTIQVSYVLGKSGDVAMSATADFKGPKKPPSSAAAFINDNGELTLFSPFLRRMQGGLRDATPGDFDPETGEVRDV